MEPRPIDPMIQALAQEAVNLLGYTKYPRECLGFVGADCYVPRKPPKKTKDQNYPRVIVRPGNLAIYGLNYSVSFTQHPIQKWVVGIRDGLPDDQTLDILFERNDVWQSAEGLIDAYEDAEARYRRLWQYHPSKGKKTTGKVYASQTEVPDAKRKRSA